jgi:magnesium-transporting ATPase (P-type)
MVELMQNYTETETEQTDKQESNISLLSKKNEYDQSKNPEQINILVCLLKEYTDKKMRISSAIRTCYYQIYAIQLVGLCTALLFYRFYRLSLGTLAKASSINSVFIITFTIFMLSLCLYIMSSGFRKFVVFSKSFQRNYVVFCSILFSVSFMLLIQILGESSYASFSIIVTLFLTLFIVNRLGNMWSEIKVIDYNLSKVIRAASQVREHIASGFGTRVELEVRLTEAENALENFKSNPKYS